MSKKRERQIKAAIRLQDEITGRLCLGRQIGSRPTKDLIHELAKLETQCGGLPEYAINDVMIRAGLELFLRRDESEMQKPASARRGICPPGVCSSALTYFRMGRRKEARRVLELESDKTWAYPEFRFFVCRFIFGERVCNSTV